MDVSNDRVEAALEACRAELRQFKGAIEAADHAIYVTDTTPTIVYVNPAFEGLTGYTAEEALGSNPRLLQSGIQTESYYQRLWKTLEEGRIWREELVNRKKDGTLYHAFQIISPIQDSDGNVSNYVAIQHDMTIQKEIESALRRTSQEQSAVFNNTQEALFLIEVENERTFRYVKLNPAHEKATGLTTDDVRGKSPSEVLDPETAAAVAKRYASCVADKQAISYEESLDLPAGQRIWSTTLSPIVADGKVVQIVGSARDITTKKELEEKLRYYSDIDQLTELYNRRKSMEELDREMHRTARYGHTLSLLLVDIDHFKSINDSLGHSRGDDVLRGFAHAVNKLTRPTDIIGRWGGEEFLIVLSETDLDGALRLAERIREGVQNASLLPDRPVTVSIGVATLSEKVSNRDDLINIADIALYRAKEAGRNRVASER